MGILTGSLGILFCWLKLLKLRQAGLESAVIFDLEDRRLNIRQRSHCLQFVFPIDLLNNCVEIFSALN